jgi:putative SOS response-associated peptidase YedK
MLKTINCRDDSLIEDRGMWTSMKKKKRCIVVAQGFYEWLKKNNSKERVPHFTKRKDGQLMCFAGLWDSVSYEGKSRFVWYQVHKAYDQDAARSAPHAYTRHLQRRLQ